MTTISHINRPQPACMNLDKKTSDSQSGNKKAEDTPCISDTSMLMANAETAALAETGIDQAKVDQIKQAIETGELTIDYEKLAQKMLDFEFSLFDK